MLKGQNQESNTAMAPTTAPATPPTTSPACAPRNQKERKRQQTEGFDQANEEIKQQRTAPLPTDGKSPDVSLWKQVITARAQAKARLTAEKTLNTARSAQQAAKWRLEQAKFGSRGLFLHFINLLHSINNVGEKKPAALFAERIGCSLQRRQEAPPPVKAAGCYEDPEHDNLPHFIEGVKSLEKQNNSKLSIVMIKEKDGRFESTGNDTNVTQLLRNAV